MIDWTQVKSLESEIGVEDFGEILEVFIEEVDAAVAALGTSGTADDALARDLHFLKGSAANLGFAELAAFCAIGEKQALEGAGSSVDLTKVSALYESSKAEFFDKAELHISYTP